MATRYGFQIAAVSTVSLLALGCVRDRAPVRGASEAPLTLRAPGAGEAVCVSEELRAHGVAQTVVREHGALSFCLSASGTAPSDARACFDVDTALGAYGAAPEVPVGRATDPRTWALPQQDGVRVATTATEVTVCTKLVGCNTLTPEGFRGAGVGLPAKLRAHVPAAANEDGSRVFVVRHEGRGGENVVGEMYDVGSARRLTRFAIRTEGHVDAVSWVGHRIFSIACVDGASSCVGDVLDPLTGGTLAYSDGPLSAQVFGIDSPLVYVRDNVWAVVSRTGITWLDMADGSRLRRLALPDDAGTDAPISVTRPDGATLALVYSAPWAGRVRLIGLRSTTLRATLSPPVCDVARAAHIAGR